VRTAKGGFDNIKLTTLSSASPDKMERKYQPFTQEEKGVIKVDQYELIKTGYRLYGQNISELSRLTGHSRNTIKKALRGEPRGYFTCQAIPCLNL
jgi:ActR/RegA family two-component response regulator